jgi:hypothetical protein
MLIIFVKQIVCKGNLIKIVVHACSNVIIGWIDFIRSNNKKILINKELYYLVVILYLLLKEWNIKRLVLKQKWKLKIMLICSIIYLMRKFNNVLKRNEFNKKSLLMFYKNLFIGYLSKKVIKIKILNNSFLNISIYLF